MLHPNKSTTILFSFSSTKFKFGSRGGTGEPDPPGKSQVIWVSIGNKQSGGGGDPGQSDKKSSDNVFF